MGSGRNTLSKNRERLDLLGRLDQIRFEDEMRGYAAVAVRDLFGDVAEHVPVLQRTADQLDTTGRPPDDPDVRKAIAFLATISTGSLPRSYRGYNCAQVEKIIGVVREFAIEFSETIEQPMIAVRSNGNGRRGGHEIRPLVRLEDIQFDREFLGFSTTAVDHYLDSLLEHLPNLEFGLDYLSANEHLPEDDGFQQAMVALERVSTAELPRSLVGYSTRQVRQVLRALTNVPGEIRLSSSQLRQ